MKKILLISLMSVATFANERDVSKENVQKIGTLAIEKFNNEHPNWQPLGALLLDQSSCAYTGLRQSWIQCDLQIETDYSNDSLEVIVKENGESFEILDLEYIPGC